MPPSRTSSDVSLSTEWQWKPLLGWSIAALLFAASWLWPATRACWDLLDAALFRALNGTVAWGEPFAIFWALADSGQFLAFLLLASFVIYFRVIARGDLDRFRDGLGFAVFTALVLAVAFFLLKTVAQPRLSPSLVFETYHSIGNLVPWAQTTENSSASFPDIRTSLMIVLAALWWRGLTWRLGLAGAALAFLFTLPPIAAGAHWPTDAAVTGGTLAMLTLAIMSGTPAAAWITHAAARPAGWAISRWQGFVNELSPEGLDNPNPTRQVLRGMCVGAADLVPGVSGGTMALILGIYKRLIAAIAHVDKEFLQLLLRGRLLAAARHIDFMFILPLGIGVLLSLIIFSRVVPLSLMVTHLPEITFGFFFGLIAASIVGLISHIEPKGFASWIWMALGVCLGLLAAVLVPVQTPDAWWFIFLCGMAAIAAMLVPGISGSFVLLILGKYTDAIDALGRLDTAFLLPLLAGVVTGALAFSRAIAWLLNHYYRQTILTVIGVLGGSLLAVWPFKDRQYEMVGEKTRLVAAHPYVPTNLDWTVISGVVAILAGVFLYRLLDRLAQHTEQTDTV
ncbi:protein of unknown function DUF368 [Parvibaculum lavamentivorans DS-1]|uniref:Phosphoesterase PA-phosphatase related n=1 Tax=Parvibaculum lavamentivorans (strain DS-1 / DSM 13023 / NCIMB 13966) TaxID=402881 RepID=A7HUG8_PARL1|nr:DUF368 domain-containing protein [Parvibaculum lavamentivorans]ABS63551.1 protein of unknown function DUF368 [Parvibaculum lavamentivorans DS-1]